MVTLARGTVRGNGAGRFFSPVPMELGQIAKYAPSVLAENKHESRSERYTYVPTIQIVNHLRANGYGVFSVQQSGARAEDRRGHTKHLVRFRPLNAEVMVGGTHPEIVLMNSHDGSSAYRLMAGLFRLICSNGLVAAQSTISDIRIQHTGNILENVSEGVEQLREQLPALAGKVEQFQRIQLTMGERELFGRAALAVKYGTTEDAPIGGQQIIAPCRREDTEPSLWNTLNAVQENLIQGGNRYIKRTERSVQRRKTNPVNGVDQSTAINRAVWQLAEEMAKLKS